jgi:hypothetical protein
LNPWIGVDLDGTLARYDGWKGADHIGDPIPKMLARVKLWLEQGKEVRIFTARVGPAGRAGIPVEQVRESIEQWCLQHIGVKLPVTNLKDFGMVQLWDDRAIQVVPNTGFRADGAECEHGVDTFEYHCAECSGDPR